jgi:hypothetical protein
MTVTTNPGTTAPAVPASSTARVAERSRRDDVASIPTALHSE